MGAVTDMDVSLLESFRTEWASLRVKRQNVLLEGSCRATNAALSVLPQMSESILCRPTRTFDLPSAHVPTLILKNVGELGAANQTRLLAWIGGDGSGTQIISTSEDPLFTAVTRGVFVEALYYRLNVMLLRLDSRMSVAVAGRGAGHSMSTIDGGTKLSASRRAPVLTVTEAPNALLATTASSTEEDQA